MTSKDLFLNELRNQYDKELELRNSLDTKANYLITISGIIISLLFGFALLLLQKIDPHYPYLTLMRLLLGLVLMLNLGSVICAILGFRIRIYQYAFIHKNFYKKDDILHSKIAEYVDAPIDEFNDMLLTEYLKCNKINFEIN